VPENLVDWPIKRGQVVKIELYMCHTVSRVGIGSTPGEECSPMRSVLNAFFFVTVIALATRPASAQNSIALWLEASGEIQPAVAPMTELAAKAIFTLAPQAHVGFYHLRTCNVVVVQGGVLAISSKGYRVSDRGKLVDEQKRRCPVRVRILGRSSSAGMTTAGLTMRGGVKKQTREFSAAPSFVLIGKQAHRADGVEIAAFAGDKYTVLPISEKRATWPLGEEFLTVGAQYTLRLLDGDGIELAKLTFVASSDSSSAQEFDVLRVD